jgi:hypothetical protein
VPDPQDNYQGSCDTSSDDGSAGGNLVFTFTLAEESSVSFTVSGYDSILYFFEGSACANERTCVDAVGNEETLALPRLAAGEYSLVVDTYIGVLDNDGNRQDQGGPFTLVFYPDGFPAPQACIGATVATVPTAGSPATFTVDYSGAPQELVGGDGAERVFSLSPVADVTLDITTGGAAGAVDTVAYLLAGSCDESTALATSETAGTCSDDSARVANFGSVLTVSLTAGTTYDLVVDAHGETSGTAGVTITVVE